jgi:hypothetical protein
MLVMTAGRERTGTEGTVSSLRHAPRRRPNASFRSALECRGPVSGGPIAWAQGFAKPLEVPAEHYLI